MIGGRFNFLTVLDESRFKEYGATSMICECDCGTITKASPSQLRRGTKKSCGCLKSSNLPKGQKKNLVSVGDRFKNLEVVEPVIACRDGHYRCIVRCDCGNITEVTAFNLCKGRQTTCGCGISRATHGLSGSRLWSIYHHMRRRCTVPEEAGYDRYGARGITVCEEWGTFTGFWEDMKDGYSDDLELDRINSDGNYCKENCRWVDSSVQSFNTRKKINNTSGRSGVSWNTKREKWETYINKDRKRVLLGMFTSFEEACAAREEAELKYYGFTKE